jgi:hypothetical protein
MSDRTDAPIATHRHEAGGLSATLDFLKRTRAELRQLRRVIMGTDWLRVEDVNRQAFEVSGLGYADPDIINVLDSLNAAYDPRTVHHPLDSGVKEFALGRCRPWAEDRVM